MRYAEVRRAVFLSRPNRFIAECRTEEGVLRCHVSNTGRCRELLVPGRTAILAKAANAGRQTSWDLVAVWKDDGLLVNLDSQAPNRVVKESFARIVGPCTALRPE